MSGADFSGFKVCSKGPALADLCAVAMSDIPRTFGEVLEAKVALERLSAYLNQPEVEPSLWNTSHQKITLEKATIGWPKAHFDETGASQPFVLQDLEFQLPEMCLTLVCGPLGSGKTLFVSPSKEAFAYLTSSELCLERPGLNMDQSLRPDPRLMPSLSTVMKFTMPGPQLLGLKTASHTPRNKATFATERFGITSFSANPCGESGTMRSYVRRLCSQTCKSCRKAT